MMKIAILGSTGSIGTQTLDIVREQGDIQVTAIAAGSNIKKLEEQMREFHPLLVCVFQEDAAKELRDRTKDLNVRVVSGMDGLLEVAVQPESEILVTAIVGMLGISPTIAAIEARKKIALANKETLVTAGHIIMPLAKKCGVPILPVDSEHSAIFQSLQGENGNRIAKILLTASGGPFRGKKPEDLAHIQVEDALRHPNWTMGRKITIDSSTLVNKGLEVMEAKWLFDVELEQIEVVVHPQSVIHSAVQYEDGAVIAQLGTPDMRLPIQLALTWPQRVPCKVPRMSLAEVAKLTFYAPDYEAFPALNLAKHAASLKGDRGAVLNGANEAAVGLFLNGKIGFTDIAERVAYALDTIPYKKDITLDDVLAADKAAREIVLG